MDNIKMVALDLDGTLLKPDSTLSDYSIDVLRALDAKGIKVVICTGRLYEGARYYTDRLGIENPGIFCNGAQTRAVLDGKILDERPLPLEVAQAAISLGESYGGQPRAYVDDRIYVSRLTEDDRRYSQWTRVAVEEVGNLAAFLAKAPLKLINCMPDPACLSPLLAKSKDFFGQRAYVTRSMSVFVEYMNPEATKGTGLKKLADRWQIDKKDIVVAGDHFNDLPMFEAAGLSIAPANAEEEVRARASVVSEGNQEDGVSRKLQELFL